MLTGASASDVRFIERVRASPFIFTATVLKTDASRVLQVSTSTRLVVVRVATVFRAPAVLGSLARTRLVVQLGPSASIGAGDAALFYATSWLYGEAVAVVEVARERVPKDPQDFLARVARAEVWLADEQLTARVRAADLVLTGRVELTAAAPTEARSPRSEHEPLWWRADIAIDQVEKGSVTAPRYSAYFPSSLDSYWLDVPKLQPGQAGIFLLHRQLRGVATQFAPPGLALLDRHDVQPDSHIERIRALLKLSGR